jgi:hypothetical protein
LKEPHVKALLPLAGCLLLSLATCCALAMGLPHRTLLQDKQPTVSRPVGRALPRRFDDGRRAPRAATLTGAFPGEHR